MKRYTNEWFRHRDRRRRPQRAPPLTQMNQVSPSRNYLYTHVTRIASRRSTDRKLYVTLPAAPTLLLLHLLSHSARASPFLPPPHTSDTSTSTANIPFRSTMPLFRPGRRVRSHVVQRAATGRGTVRGAGRGTGRGTGRTRAMSASDGVPIARGPAAAA